MRKIYKIRWLTIRVKSNRVMMKLTSSMMDFTRVVSKIYNFFYFTKIILKLVQEIYREFHLK